ncbi:acylphosphatase [Echinicola jeungdonensis]|uniref:Acylphosphatase n=1 Tax=Echinicola jeungdonensis TaxID=709343 RepID=A0ABV5JB02_9BACT|nr:acylphosphatase [Echinicola jeungdonensis]MDN3669462.1 acylphosphatase [Echinicola jeungdonensis]
MNKTIKITGKVQGVFFRKSTQDKAIELGVKGWVKNEADGSVLTEIEGSSEQLHAMEKWLKSGPDRAVVENLEVLKEGESKGYREFEFKY